MLFKVKAKNLSVYDPKTDSIIAEFVNGEFTTEDGAKITRLKELEYYPEPTTVEVKEGDNVSITPPIGFVKEEKPKRKRKQ